jgi:hypothetical protein
MCIRPRFTRADARRVVGLSRRADRLPAQDGAGRHHGGLDCAENSAGAERKPDEQSVMPAGATWPLQCGSLSLPLSR